VINVSIFLRKYFRTKVKLYSNTEVFYQSPTRTSSRVRFPLALNGTFEVISNITAYVYSTISLDILPKFNPDVCCNIMYFDYLKTAHPEGHFDFIWASLSCTELEHPMGGSPDSNAPMAHYTYLRRLR
jgi:hypothetical protein